jgi:acyl-CoA synthetase (AMP-forming)/AMP-acid ligase II
LTIVDVIRSRARTDGHQAALVFLERGEREAERATYGELDGAARAVAAALLDAETAAKPVLVALPSGMDFVRAFLGCLYAGAYAVPAPYPLQRRNWDRIARFWPMPALRWC